MRRARRRRAAGGALAALGLALAGCGLLGGGDAGEEGAKEEEARGWSPVPVGRSQHPIGGRVSYDLASVTRRGDDVVVDLDLQNGTGRLYATAGVEVTVHGAEGRSRTHWRPVGVLGSQRSKRVVVRIPDVPFEVTDVSVELYAR